MNDYHDPSCSIYKTESRSLLSNFTRRDGIGYDKASPEMIPLSPGQISTRWLRVAGGGNETLSPNPANQKLPSVERKTTNRRVGRHHAGRHIASDELA
jgi:hypothetical protein